PAPPAGRTGSRPPPRRPRCGRGCGSTPSAGSRTTSGSSSPSAAPPRLPRGRPGSRAPFPWRAWGGTPLPGGASRCARSVPAGGLMFVAHATEFAGNPAFRLKLLLLVLATLNAALFHLRPFRQVAGWDHGTRTPLAARVAAGLSLMLWTGVIACGRLLAYF